MMENKYAQNILASIRSEPKFEVGELVQLRANVSRDNFKGSHLSAQAKAFMVVEVGSRPVTRALSYDEKRGGTRWYKLLVMGSTDTIEVIEKELKRPTKKLLGKNKSFFLDNYHQTCYITYINKNNGGSNELS